MRSYQGWINRELVHRREQAQAVLLLPPSQMEVHRQDTEQAQEGMGDRLGFRQANSHFTNSWTSRLKLANNPVDCK
jgi:hypothetical protein